jgi:hypothetical protein
MRYRPAISLPGRNRPSLEMYSAALREDELRDDEGGRCGMGEVAFEKSMVGTSSVFAAGAPQEGQKRAMLAISEPQEEQYAMKFPATG